jgi:archaeosine synthase beta-subunit
VRETLIYPQSSSARSRWILARRGAKNAVDAAKPYAYQWEEELDATGKLQATATVFLTNRECPYRCLMCDLWQNTLDESVAPGAISAQVRFALDQLPQARQIKLYNAGSFFDPKAIPIQDYPQIAEVVSGMDRVIVESHPHLVGVRTTRFQAMLDGKLEVAIGLETVEPAVLDRLNKQFTVADFRRSARFLRENAIDLRVFVLLRPPFLSEQAGVHWAQRTIEEAFAVGATAVCVIPTRAGNGAMEALAESGSFSPPSLRSLECVLEWGIGLNRGRLFADLWNAERFSTCGCSRARIERLAAMNQRQSFEPPVVCGKCGDESND